MKQRTCLTIGLLSFAAIASGQGRIELEFPRFPGQTVKLYYFLGNKVDSLSAALDAEGRGEALQPFFGEAAKEGVALRGMAQLAIADAGGIECIVGEPRLRVVCREETIDKETVAFPGSEENAFLYDSFERKSRLMEIQGWLQAGRQFYPASSPLSAALEKEGQATVAALTAIDEEIAASPLYAARFIEWAGFMNRLFEAEQQRDPEKARMIREEMETAARIDFLYTAGQLWGSVQNFYISLFNRLDTPAKQEEYAASIVRTAARLSGEVRERFFVDAVSEAERFGWAKSQEIIAQAIAEEYPDMLPEGSNLQRLVGMYRTGIGSQAPALVGAPFTGTDKRFASPTLLVFYETGCNSCDNELRQLKAHYAEWQAKGFRVVSISADQDSLVYDYHSKDFPWEDKRCDYQGFEGENFKNYGVIGTPTIFLIDENGIIQGRYASMNVLNEK